MERYEVGDDARLGALIDAARRGEEAVFTRDGTPVATLRPADPEASELRTRDGREPRRGIDMDALRASHAKLPQGLAGANTAALIRKLRDMDEH